MNRVELRRLFWRGAAAILVVAALIALLALLRGHFGDTDGKILFVLGALFLTGSTAIAAAALLERGEREHFAWATIASAAIAFLLLTYVAAADWDVGETMGRLIGSATLIVVGELVVASNRLLLREPRVRPVAIGCETMVWAATVLSLVFVWLDTDAGDGGFKLLAACWVLAALGWFLVPVLQRLGAASAPTQGAVEEADLVVAEIEGIQLVAGGSSAEGLLAVESVNGALVIRSPSGALDLRPGQRLVVRKR